MITLTKELLDGLRTPAGGYNQKTTLILGTAWPLESGWRARLVGTEISERNYAAAKKAAAEGRRHRFNGNRGRSRRASR